MNKQIVQADKTSCSFDHDPAKGAGPGKPALLTPTGIPKKQTVFLVNLKKNTSVHY